MSTELDPFSDQLHADKYRLPGESYREKCNRVAAALCDRNEHFQQYREITLNMRFLEGGRVQAAVGSPKQVTAFNCFVNGTVHDSFVHGDGSIMQRATDTAQTMRMGGGVGTDFSTLRPSGDLIQGVQARTNGPLAFLPIWDAVCKATSSSGNRRGALMGVMRVDHPDIEEYIYVKQKPGVLEGFNLSIAITNEFMDCLIKRKPFDLRFNGQVYKTVDAAALWETIMRSTWDWAEPGVIFIDTVNELNNLWYCETIAATNPCGEQPLPPNGACLLGSFNLAKYLYKYEGRYCFDYTQLSQDVPVVVRAMDNIIDRTIYPLKAQEIEAKNKRRMGLGVTGLANAIEACGYSYGSAPFLEMQKQIMTVIRDECYRASADLAEEKGSFPLYERDKYISGKFIATLPDKLQSYIYDKGIRNSHLLSVAPTGTISLCANNVSSGIEPVFAHEVVRSVYSAHGSDQMKVKLMDYGYGTLGVEGKLAKYVTAKEHVEVLAIASNLVDSAVSKTCNVSPDMPWEDFKEIYITAWLKGCKGCTTFNAGGKRMGILAEAPAKATEPENSACFVDTETGRKECT